VLIWKRWRGDANEMPPLHWRPTSGDTDEGSLMHDQYKADGSRTVAILCCKNGHHCALVLGGASRFAVDSAGIVTPSVQCPVEISGAKCDGHEGPPSQLEGWGT